MIDKKWLTQKHILNGTFYHRTGGPELFEGDVNLYSINDLIYNKETNRVVGTEGESIQFASPKHMEQFREKNYEFDVFEDVTLEIYSIRTEKETTEKYFIPSERGVYFKSPFRNGFLTKESTGCDYRIWYQYTKFNTDKRGYPDKKKHAQVCVPIDSRFPEVSENRNQKTGLNQEFEPLALIQPYGHLEM